jgi:hypothetical protein
MALCLIVLLLVVGILIYKSSGIKCKASRDNAKDASFAVTRAAPKSIPVNNSVKTEKQVDAIAIKATPSVVKNSTIPEATPKGRMIGEYLASLSSLNKVASSHDTVFVFIPAPRSESADDATTNAIIAAQQALKSKNISLGLYTLPNSSPDYAAISAQIQTPAILVASRGKGMATVSGEVTETKLLQAYISSARAGGCGPSSGGCGPSSSGCN